MNNFEIQISKCLELYAPSPACPELVEGCPMLFNLFHLFTRINVAFLAGCCYHAAAKLSVEDAYKISLPLPKSDKGANMPMIRNISRTKIILEHVTDEPLVIEPNETVEVPQEALSIPLIKHYVEVKRLDIIRKQTQPSSFILSR